MKEFLTYFFGAGDTPEFSIFTLAHLIPILLLGAALFVLYRRRERLRASKYETNLRYILGFALIMCDMSYYWRLAAGPWLSGGPAENLPIGVCGWAVIFCSFAASGLAGFSSLGRLFLMVSNSAVSFCTVCSSS